MNFTDKVRAMMDRSGKTYYQCCKALGAAGGRRAAANKRKRREQQEKFHMEQQRQVAMGLRSPDELPDPIFTESDKRFIAQGPGPLLGGSR